jgi:hypothetical protein
MNDVMSHAVDGELKLDGNGTDHADHLVGAFKASAKLACCGDLEPDAITRLEGDGAVVRIVGGFVGSSSTVEGSDSGSLQGRDASV